MGEDRDAAAAFDRALEAAGLAPDPQDREAALAVFRYLRQAQAALARAERGDDDPA